MRYRLRLYVWVLFALAACVGPLARGTATSEPVTTVKVDNRAFLDMTVYVMRSAERVRLGIAPGGTTVTFHIPAGIVAMAQPLRFVSDPIGGARASVSEEISVQPGDQVTMIIPPS